MNRWYHVTWTHEDKKDFLYIDGLFDTSYTSINHPDSFIPSNNIFIGNCFVNSAHRPFNGYIDEVSIWNRALSESEVYQLYNNGSELSLKQQ